MSLLFDVLSSHLVFYPYCPELTWQSWHGHVLHCTVLWVAVLVLNSVSCPSVRMLFNFFISIWPLLKRSVFYWSVKNQLTDKKSCESALLRNINVNTVHYVIFYGIQKCLRTLRVTYDTLCRQWWIWTLVLKWNWILP